MYFEMGFSEESQESWAMFKEEFQKGELEVQQAPAALEGAPEAESKATQAVQPKAIQGAPKAESKATQECRLR